MKNRQLLTDSLTHLLTRRGQSTLEYILVLGAILGVVIAGAAMIMKPAVEKSLTDSSDTIQAATGKIKGGLGL